MNRKVYHTVSGLGLQRDRCRVTLLPGEAGSPCHRATASPRHRVAASAVAVSPGHLVTASPRHRVAASAVFRRGSALMVALALLMILAVFAALFLTSSRFDQDASTATVDYVRMDLYAEGLAQYVQSCMVYGLWGFDDKPLNNDGIDPWGTTAPTAMPGPDSPFDYFGGRCVVDPDGTPSSGDEYYCYPDFWLSDPRVHGAGTARVFLHPAFAPTDAATDHPPYGYDQSTLATPSDKATFWWQWADLDNDGKPDTPWRFVKPLGNNLYLRAAVYVEDTSSRVNVNAANQPIPASADLAAIYKGYPGDITPPTFGDEIVGTFLSEFNLVGMATAGTVDILDNGDGVSFPGRYGKQPTGKGAWPYAIDVPTDLLAISKPVPEMQRLLLGDPSLGSGGSGRLSTILANRLGYTWATNAATYDPDGLVRRIEAPALFSGASAPEQDRPFTPDETFDLMSLLGYTKPGGLPAKTRLETLWPALCDGSSTVPWRRLLTTYSWTANLCPHGEDPYADSSYRKVNLNTCSAIQLRRAIGAAKSHALYGSLTDDQMDQMAVNFIAYRNRPMSPADLGIYLMAVYDMYKVDNKSLPTTVPPPAWLEWAPAAWTAYVNIQTFSTTKTELAYLQELDAQRGSAAFWAEIANALAATPAISPMTVPQMNRTTGAGKVFGLARSPYITEVWRSIQYPINVSLPQDPSDNTKTNDYAIELYNPWSNTLSLDGWYIYVRGSAAGDIVADLAGHTIGPMNRFVVRRLGAGDLSAPNLVLATQIAGNMKAQLVYSPDGAPDVTDHALFDEVPETELTAFQGGSPPTANAGSRYRRDDHGFWCYQRWYDDPVGTLGIANLATAADEPWDPTTYGPNPAVPIAEVGQILSPAELALIPCDAPQQVRSGTGTGKTLAEATKSTDMTSDIQRLGTLQFAKPELFHRGYVQPTAGTTEPVVPSANAGVLQALFDYVTAVDFTEDGIDNNGDGKGISTADLAELRVPGRLNVNTISDDFLKLDMGACNLPLLPLTDPRNNTLGIGRDVAFWQNLNQFRDLSGTYAAGRSGAATNNPLLYTSEPGYTKPGISQLGELCSLQAYNTGTNAIDFQGFWQDRDTKGEGTFELSYMLPAQHIRRFAANANLLSVRSDTYMATVRVEIVKRVCDSAGTLTRIDSFGQREYMYLIDRSFCLKPPQLNANAANRFTGNWNAAFIPPRVWRMSVPK